MKRTGKNLLVLFLALVMTVSVVIPALAADGDAIPYTGDEVTFVKEDGVSVFGMLSPQDGTTCVINGDNVVIHYVPQNTTVYNAIHWGYITDELTRDVNFNSDGTFDIILPKTNCGTLIPVAPVKPAGGSTREQYYLAIPAAGKLEDVTPAPARTDLTITNNTGMFKAVEAYLETVDGQEYLVVALSGSGYRHLYKGTYAEAVANGDNRDNWIIGEQVDGKWTFRIPVSESDSYIPVVAISYSYLTKYENGQNPLERAFYPRQMELNREAATLVTGDYDETATYTVSAEGIKVAGTAQVHVVGGPNSNNYRVAPVLVMEEETYDQITYPTVADGKLTTATAALTDGAFAIDMLNAPNLAAFHDGEEIELQIRNAETGENETMTMTVDLMARTITLHKDSPAPARTDLTIVNNTGMFKAYSAYVENADGKTVLVVALNGNTYEYLYRGTYAEAVANGDNRENWVAGAKDANGKWSFRFKLAEGETYIPVVSISKTYLTKYENGENPLERAFFPRQFQLDLDAGTLTVGDYDETAEFTVSAEGIQVAGTAQVHVVGGPNSNNFRVAPVLVMEEETYDQITYPTVADGKLTTATAELTDGAFAIDMLNAPNLAAFHDGEEIELQIRNAETGENETLTMTVDLMARTITLHKDSEEEPSPEPSTEPSPEPSTEPSAEPSTEPSAEPSTEPSSEPAGEQAEYYFVQGENASWSPDAGNLVIIVKRTEDDGKTFSLFTGVQVDGKDVDAANYTAAAGSVNLTMNAEYLKTLSAGEHTLTLLFADGKAETKLTVKSDNSGTGTQPGTGPRTGDYGAILWVVLMGASAAGLVGLEMNRRRKEH